MILCQKFQTQTKKKEIDEKLIYVCPDKNLNHKNYATQQESQSWLKKKPEYNFSNLAKQAESVGIAKERKIRLGYRRTNIFYRIVK